MLSSLFVLLFLLLLLLPLLLSSLLLSLSIITISFFFKFFKTLACMAHQKLVIGNDKFFKLNMGRIEREGAIVNNSYCKIFPFFRSTGADQLSGLQGIPIFISSTNDECLVGVDL